MDRYTKFDKVMLTLIPLVIALVAFAWFMNMLFIYGDFPLEKK